MDNLNELKTIWQTAKADDLPSAAEMLRIVKQFRNRKLRNKTWAIVVGVIGIIVSITIVSITPHLMLSTKAGVACTIAACVVLATTNIRSIKRFIDLKDCSNLEFISFLEQTRRNQLYYHQKTQVTGMILSFAGMLLYLYEFVHKSPILTLVFYTLAISWILFMWFYKRPRDFKKQSEKLNGTIKKFEKITDQIK
ncbi:hypothetical protein [Mucilaginibacter boryungensis]|uniref:DUF4231 domain-containing protein n=1 Tax=Mucilaginibacter boryungensis TaxID=768480 RepID=A0ABR9XNY0_9SPHI|nr:hypothetical protein [Mucilaginibacter boryungensis]MBE9668785.1 hypothetical protein [Mucilaginibacter boryungensis]